MMLPLDGGLIPGDQWDDIIREVLTGAAGSTGLDGQWRDRLSEATDGSLAPDTTSNAGGGGPHNNLQPYVTMNYIIKL